MIIRHNIHRSAYFQPAFLYSVINCCHCLISDTSFTFRLLLHFLVQISLLFHHKSDLVAQWDFQLKHPEEMLEFCKGSSDQITENGLSLSKMQKLTYFLGDVLAFLSVLADWTHQLDWCEENQEVSPQVEEQSKTKNATEWRIQRWREKILKKYIKQQTKRHKGQWKTLEYNPHQKALGNMTRVLARAMYSAQ